ncbi:hypothetical protein ACHMW6_18015 [Pseudoduganella sp. UC29_106]|uniref:hypothetical protein n=1 Tax=Pseudoduganella sp. UC29_106 TaxID=3374553 RepID=UPI003757FB61
MPRVLIGDRHARYHAGWQSSWRWSEKLQSLILSVALLPRGAERLRAETRHWGTRNFPGTLAFRRDARREQGALQLYDEEGFDAFSWLVMHAEMQHWPHSTEAVLQESSYNEAQHAPVARLPAHGPFSKHGL